MRFLRGSGRSAVVGIAAAAMLVPGTTAVAQSAETPDVPTAAEAAAGWLTGQFVAGERLDTTFDGQTYPDAGLTADGVLALAGAGVGADTITSATDWLASQVATYTGDGEAEIYAGATAKLVLVAEATGRDATDIGGRDLVAQLAGLEDATTGRFSDVSQWGDFSNALTQSLAIIALERATDAGASEEAVGLLADAACDDGGVPEQFANDDCAGAVDATGFAVQAFLAAGATDAADAAVAWLLEQQADDGSFGGGGADANANSTGIAAAALAVAGEDEAAAAAVAWLVDAQYDCAGVAPGAVPYTPGDAGDLQRATTQALPGLTGSGLLDVSAAGATADAPALDCPHRFSDVDYTSPHAGPITDLAEAGIVQGRPDGTFAPAEGVTRAQLASFIGRAAGIAPATGETDFSDVPADHTHAGYIQALADADVISGYADGTYRPSQVVRRDQAAALIARWLDLDPVDTDRFTDIAGLAHRGWINALADVEVARGTGDGSTYSPARTLQRDQVASLLHRALGVADAA